MNNSLHLFPAPQSCTLTGGSLSSAEDPSLMEIPVEKSAHLPDQGYRLRIGREKIVIHACSNEAAFYAGQTLKQILDQSGGEIPCLEIEDWPEITTRGLMLDVSRCKVPTMDAMFDLIDWMASLKLNQLQLYIEHTFAFPGHEVVWEAASPFTPGEIRELDVYCKDRYIELVPNFNSFGHMERWLRHEPYKHLAECPDGFYSSLLKLHFTHGTTLFPSKESAEFIASLYDEYLPVFSSRLFNVGGDEPWELGLGKSAGLVDKVGKGRVYLDFMKEIHKLVVERNHRMMCWADIIMDHPEIIPEIPGDIIPVIWGYSANHPFDSQCAKVARYSEKFYVAPGNNSWNSLTGRLDEALENMRNAARNAIRHGADGYLITTWGDNGNHQPWIIQYPGILQGACSAWAPGRNQELDLADYFNSFFFEESSLGEQLIRMGRMEESLPLPFPDHPSGRSSTHFYLFSTPGELKERLEEKGSIPPESALKQYIEEARQFESELSGMKPAGKDKVALEEITLGLRMAGIGARRAGIILYGWEDAGWLNDLETIKEQYRQAWLLRAREGGLEESLGHFSKSATLAP